MKSILFNENDILVLGTILNTIKEKGSLCFCDECSEVYSDFYDSIGSQLMEFYEKAPRH